MDSCFQLGNAPLSSFGQALRAGSEPTDGRPWSQNPTAHLRLGRRPIIPHARFQDKILLRDLGAVQPYRQRSVRQFDCFNNDFRIAGARTPPGCPHAIVQVRFHCYKASNVSVVPTTGGGMIDRRDIHSSLASSSDGPIYRACLSAQGILSSMLHRSLFSIRCYLTGGLGVSTLRRHNEPYPFRFQGHPLRVRSPRKKTKALGIFFCISRISDIAGSRIIEPFIRPVELSEQFYSPRVGVESNSKATLRSSRRDSRLRHRDRTSPDDLPSPQSNQSKSKGIKVRPV